MGGSNRSHPVRVRGLKSVDELYVNNDVVVAPRAGAWIEILQLGQLGG